LAESWFSNAPASRPSTLNFAALSPNGQAYATPDSTPDVSRPTLGSRSSTTPDAGDFSPDILIDDFFAKILQCEYGPSVHEQVAEAMSRGVLEIDLLGQMQHACDRCWTTAVHSTVYAASLLARYDTRDFNVQWADGERRLAARVVDRNPCLVEVGLEVLSPLYEGDIVLHKRTEAYKATFTMRAAVVVLAVEYA
jgi:hypothetical protein